MSDLTPAELERFSDLIAEKVAARLAATPEMLDRRGLCQALGLGMTTIDRLVREGRIPSVQAGRRRLFDLGAVKQALRAP